MPPDRRPRSRANLEQRLRDHHTVLVECSKLFDAGKAVMALPLSVSIRTLVHDKGKKPTSLLGQLGAKSTFRFRNTATHIDRRNTHVDPTREEDLRRFEEENAIGITFSDDLSGAQTPVNGPQLPSVRQVAHELRRTLEEGLGNLLGDAR